MTAPIAAIIEPAAGGHRLAYVRLLADAAIASHLQPVLITDSANLTTAEFAIHLRTLVEAGQLLVAAPSFVVARELGWRRVRSAMLALDDFVKTESGMGSSRSVSKIVFPEGDGQLLAVATLGHSHGWHGRTSVLIMRRAAFDLRRPRSIPRALAKAPLIALARVSGIRVYILMPSGTDTRARPWAVADPVDVVRPSASPRAVRVRLGLPSDACLVGVFGQIDPRKNVPLVASAVRESDPRLDCRLVVVGAVDPRVRAALTTQANVDQPIRIVDEYVDNELLDAYIYCMDVVVAAHSNDGPSGVVARALALGTRAVVAGSPTLLGMAARSDMIEGANLDVRSLAAAITRSCDRYTHPVPERAGRNDLSKMLA